MLQRLPEASPALRALIEKQAEGNPFYAEELVKMLIDDGVILVEGERWRVLDERLSVARIPGTLTGVLQARLDALSAAERRAVQLASVVGPVFWDDALHALDPDAPAMLGSLEQKAMVQARVESAFAGTREAAFQHHLLHQVTYDTVLKSDRREAHARTAAWLAARVGDREAEYLAVTAEHYERAGDQVRALDWYERAAAAAEARYANEAAWTYLQRMLAMPELGDSLRRWKAARTQVGVADLIADRVRHRAAVDEATRIAEALDDDALRASAAMSQALLADRLGDRTGAGSHAQRAAELAERSDAAAPGALAHAELSWLARERGDIALAHHHMALALPLATRAAQQMKWPNDDIYEVMLRLVAAQLYQAELDFDRYLQLVEEARALAEQLRPAPLALLLPRVARALGPGRPRHGAGGAAHRRPGGGRPRHRPGAAARHSALPARAAGGDRRRRCAGDGADARGGNRCSAASARAPCLGECLIAARRPADASWRPGRCARDPAGGGRNRQPAWASTARSAAAGC